VFTGRVRLREHGAHDLRRRPGITGLERPLERERRRVSGLRFDHAHHRLPSELVHIRGLEPARIGQGGELRKGRVLVDRPQPDQRKRLGRAAEIHVVAWRSEVFKTIAQRAGDRDLLIDLDQVLARQRVVQELLQVVA
jgi:hypothetical protein